MTFDLDKAHTNTLAVYGALLDLEADHQWSDARKKALDAINTSLAILLNDIGTEVRRPSPDGGKA